MPINAFIQRLEATTEAVRTAAGEYRLHTSSTIALGVFTPAGYRRSHAGSSMTRSASAEALAGAWSGGGGGGGGQNPVEECRVAGATKRLENALGLVSEPRVVAE